MKRKTNYPYLLVFIALFGLMSIPKSTAERLQGATIASFSPLFAQVSDWRFFWGSSDGSGQNVNEDILLLQLKNQLLQNEVSSLKEIVQQNTHSKKLFSLEINSIPAKVIYRSPASWNSSLWINVGEAENAEAGKVVIAKNSPVLVGTSVVGVVDYVGKHQSRVRLITDSGLTPAVRVLRGNVHHLLIADTLTNLIEMINAQEDLFDEQEKQKHLITVLDKAKNEMNQGDQFWYLAKGELHGSSQPLWRTNGQLLKGIGFNYDFADAEGPARDLRSGKPMEGTMPPMPIIQIRDLLVTTGMDGVFPPNLPVAEVTSVSLLKEGDYYYELEAKPTAGNLDELSLVFVIPPAEYNDREKPLPIGW